MDRTDTPPTPDTTDPSNTADHKMLARRIPEDAATQGNLDMLDDILTDDFVDHDSFGQDIHGVDALKEQLQALRNAFPDFTATVEETVSEDNMVATRVMLSGTHEGEFLGLEPTGNTFNVPNMVLTRIENGKIAERWVQPDTLTMLHQLGVIESPIGIREE